MPPQTAGRISKARRASKHPGQQHGKNYRWQSFSSKIANLHSLDPLHKVRRHDLDAAADEDLSATTSYLRNGLLRWADLNQTRIFTAFRRRVSPLADSLAQILHHEHDIFDALAAHIREAQALDDAREALEPLLDLLTAFAHDLGARFVSRGFDHRAFRLLVDVARHNSGAGIARSHHQQNHVLDAAVIEWTFGCLAYLFKYLARLLVADLRPTYDILAPLLGRPLLNAEVAADAADAEVASVDAEGGVLPLFTDAAAPAAPAPPTPSHRVPGHIARFTAEALSFLVRMTANPSRRDTALPLIVTHIRNDLLLAVTAPVAKKGNTPALYTQGVMALLAEASKGPSETLRLSSADLFGAVLAAIPDAEMASPATAVWTDVCCGVLTSMVHHATPDALRAMVDTVLQAADPAIKRVAAASKAKKAPTPATGPWRLAVFARMLSLLAGVRGGAKIKDPAVWSALVDTLARLLEAMAAAPATSWPDTNDLNIWTSIVTPVALVWHHAPLADVRAHVASLSKSFDRDPLARWFVPLCAFAADLAPTKFQATLQAPLQAFVAAHWSHDRNEDVLCAVLPGLAGTCALKLPQTWQDAIVAKFEQLEATPFPERGVYGKDPATWRDHCLPKYASLLAVLEASTVHPATPARIAELLLRKLRLALRPTSPALANNDETVFIVTQGFRAYLRMTKALAGSPDAGLRPLLRAAAPRFARHTGFLEALLQYEQTADDETEKTKTEKTKTEKFDNPLVLALVDNLSAPSHSLRLASLQILAILSPPVPHSDLPEDEKSADQRHEEAAAAALGIMVQTEDIGFAPHNVRNMAAHLRKLAQVYAHVRPGSWTATAIPAFLYGLLSVPLAPVWDDAIKAMKAVAETDKAGEEAIAERAFAWLDVSSGRARQAYIEQSGAAAAKRRPFANDFECFRYDTLVDKAAATATTAADPSAAMLTLFQAKQEAVPAYAGYERGKALKVLAAMPQMAEKRSRRLVPHLLSWTEDRGPRVVEEEEEEEEDEDEADEAEEDEEEEEEAKGEVGGWSFLDKKALILVFSLFTNAQVLYQADQAYDALMKLLANGDADIQKLALKAVLAWRNPVVAKYKEQLANLLDDAKFKNELALLMQSDDGEANNSHGIEHGHRADLMPVLLRILYGRSIAKKGAASGRQGLQATRLFVIRNLDVEGIGGFIGVALGSLQGVRVTDATGRLHESLFPALFPAPDSPTADDDALLLLPARKQVGVLNMLDPIINELGTKVAPYLDVLLNTTLYCLIVACRGLRSAPDEDDAPEDVPAFGKAHVTGAALMRKAKAAALRCLISLFRNAPATFDWGRYRAAIVGEVVSPVIERLPQETTQAVSVTWKLLATWAQTPHLVLFLAEDARIVPKILESLATKARDVVKVFALGMVNTLVSMVEDTSAISATRKKEILDRLLLPHMDTALLRLGAVLRSSNVETGGGEISRHLLETVVDTVVALAPLVQATTHVHSLVDIATWLLNQPSRRVNPRTKGALLVLLERFIQLDVDRETHVVDAELQDMVYRTVADLFSYFKDRDNRHTLCRILAVFAQTQPDVRVVADLCMDLNAYGSGVLDDVDYERRLGAFGRLARPAADAPALTAHQWLPLLHNCLFFVRVDDEYGLLATNAADALCTFVAAASDPVTQKPLAANVANAVQLVNHLRELVLPAMYAGARDTSEIVRREITRVFAYMIAALRQWGPLADLSPVVPVVPAESATDADLAMEDTTIDDDDRDVHRAFFTNIFAGTVEKQIQAMQVLEGINARTPLGSKNTAHFFVPLLEHFIVGRQDGVDDRGLGAQATNTIAALARSLEWNQYRAVLRRFIGFIESKPQLQKQIVRLLDKVVDAVVGSEDEAEKTTTTTLGATLPKGQKLVDEVLNGLTPPLIDYLHDKDEETVSARVPAAIILVKLLNLLPASARDAKLAGVLTDVCHILRSKSWDAREMARATLARIATILGSGTFGFVIRELRTALTRGYQLHVLSYTLHTLLMAVIPEFAQGDLDYCVEPIMAVIMDDVFGAVGEEKDADEYVTQMKEVKKSKSQDSLELVAKNVSVAQLGVLVQPLHLLMLERITKSISAKIDVLLARIAAGLAQNASVATSRDVLVFCYEMVQDVYRSRTAAQTQKETRIDPRIKKFLFQKTQRNNAGERKAGKFTYKLIAFALDVLRTVFRKYDGLRVAENVAGFVPILGDAVLAGEEEVKIAAYKLLVVLVKVTFPDMQAFSGLYQVCTKEAIKELCSAASTGSDLAQSALKLVSVVLRSRHDDVPVRAAAIDTLLAKLKDDLTNPLLRHVTFHFVRAVLDRRVESAAVYDTLDYIGTISITNDDQDTRDLARRAFFQFLREYPQQRKRWERQLEFIVANFKYQREGGRLSAMEVVYMLLLKATSALDTPAAAAGDPFVQDIVGATFLPLVMVLANDESSKCRRVAGAQLTAMLAMAKREYANEFLRMFRTWLAAEPRADLASLKMGLEMFGVYFASFASSHGDDVPVVVLPSRALTTTNIDDVQSVLDRVAALLASDKVRRGGVYGKLVTTALETVHTIVTAFPVLGLDATRAGAVWLGIEQCLWHGTHAVRMAAMRLVGMHLDDVATASRLSERVSERLDATTEFVGSYGLRLGHADVARLVRGCLSVIGTPRDQDIDPVEAEEAAKMLLHLAPYLQAEEEEEEEEAEAEADADDTDDDDDDDDNDAQKLDTDDATPLNKPMDRRFLLLRLARILRREAAPRVSSLVPKAAAMAVLEAVCARRGRHAFDTLSGKAVRAVLRPLRNLTDPTIAAPVSADGQFAPRYDDLKVRATALMDVLQTRLGNAAYTQALLAVGAATRDRRLQRATKRKIEAVVQPEKHDAHKRKRLDKKKERRKVRGAEHKEARWGVRG